MNAVLKWFALYAILMVGYYAQNRLTVGDTLYFNTLFLKDFSEVARNTGLIFLGGFLFWYFLLRSKPHPNTFTQEDPRLAHISNTPEGRFVCAPELQNPNYYKPSKKFYYFRKGEQLPAHLLLIRVPDNTIVSFYDTRVCELRAKARIDLMNHGYNAIIDVLQSTERINHINRYGVRGRPALIVSKAYTGDIDLLEKHCNDDFDNLIYGQAIQNEDP